MADFIHENLSGSRFEDVYLTGADFHGVDLTGARFRLVDMTRVTIRRADLVDMDISGQIENLRRVPHDSLAERASPVTGSAVVTQIIPEFGHLTSLAGFSTF